MVIKTIRTKSIVFKTLIFVVVFFISSLVLLIFAFKNGIKLNNLSFSGINIGELYLKYDKKLFLELTDFDYQGKRVDFNGTVSNKSGEIEINIENLYYQNLEMNFSGKLLLPIEEIKKLQEGTKKELIFFNASVTFDQALSPVLAEKLFFQFPNDFHIRFSHPTLDGVKLDNSTIDIVDLAHDGVLKIYLDIYNILDLRVLKVLGNYEVELPLKQVGGKTHTDVYIDIPFSKDLGTVITAVAKVEDGVITIGDNNLNVKHTPPNPNSKTKVKVFVELLNNKIIFDEYTFYSKNLFVEYENKTVKVSSKQNTVSQKDAILATIENLNGKLKNNLLKYGVDIKDNQKNFVTIEGKTNLNTQKTDGKLYMNHIGFEDKVSIEKEKIAFSIEHKPLNLSLYGDFGVGVKVDTNESKKIALKNFSVGYKNNIATLKSNISEGNNRFTWNNSTNFDKKITFGEFFISELHQKDLIDIQNQTLAYKVNHQPLEAHITSNLAIKVKGKDITFDNLTLYYRDKIATLKTNILESANSLRLINSTNLTTRRSIGKIDIDNYIYEESVKIKNQTLDYNIEHEPLIANIGGDVELLFRDKEKNQDKKISFSNLVARYENNIATLDGNIIENQNKITLHDTTYFDKNISKGKLIIPYFQYEDIAKLENQTINFEVKHEPLEAHLTSDLKVFLFDKEKGKDKEVFFSGLDTVYSANNIVKIATNIDEGNSSLYLTNTTNLETKLAKGTLNIKAFSYPPYLNLKDEFLQYSVAFQEGLQVSIPKYLLTYKKDNENKQTLNIGKLNNLVSKVNYVENKKLNDGTLYLFTPNNFKEMKIITNDLGIDINSSLFTQNQKETNTTTTNENQTTEDLPKISLKMFNSKVSVDNYDINTTSISFNANKQKIDLQFLPQDENNTILFHKDGDNISVQGNNISEKFIENFLKKDLFDGGNFVVAIDGNKTNLYGGISVRDTTVKNVRILNNLISFINTTPAIITPILALPTLFRMSETGFDMTGYPIRDGAVKFDYRYDTKILTLPSFYTRSKMMDFKGKGYVDIGNKKQEVGIDVIFLKDYSKFFNHIPLVGYIITGDDGNFVTNIDINGTFEEPKFTTHALSNAAEGVVNMIKRTISIPFMPFMDDKKKEDGNSTKQNTTNTTNEGN